jgi:hypothetical protein
MSLSYIGPAQVEAQQILQILDRNDKHASAVISSAVDVTELREFACQNLLSLFYFHNLYRHPDRPITMLWLKATNTITEGWYFHSLARLPDGDVKINFMEKPGYGQACFDVLLSDILLVEVSDHATPADVLARLNIKEPAGTEPKGGKRPGARRTTEPNRKALGSPDDHLLLHDDQPDAYLRHPETGRVLWPLTHKTFFDAAEGRWWPMPFTIIEAGRVVAGWQSPQAA